MAQTDITGFIYRGSLEDAHGARVLDWRPCGCCRDPFTGNWRGDRIRAYCALGADRFTLEHARLESFTAPSFA